MTQSNASNGDESDSKINSPRFEDWVQPATNWEAPGRSVTADPEQWVYAIDQLPLGTKELTTVTALEQHQQSTEQRDGSDRSESTEGVN